MCGIVGYVGERQAMPFLLEGLKKLEYRGYDSAGICECNGNLHLYKTKGKIADLENILTGCKIEGTIGIGHTRWATHGAPSQDNAHPHYDCTERIAVVHNGIIENYQQLRSMLIKERHLFSSETDTEVISHLIEKFYAGNLLKAVRLAVDKLEGSFAIAVISRDCPDNLIVVRKDSPLIVGLGDKENFVASDIPAVLEYTRSVYILEDGEIGVITPKSVSFVNGSNKTIEKEIFHARWDSAQAEKEGYADFMLKEIHEQSRAVKDTLSGRITEEGQLRLHEELSDSIFQNVNKLHLIACGTAYHACLYGKYLLEEFLDIPVEAEIASEYRYKRVKVDENTLLVVVSQSGETADTLGAMRLAQKKGAKVVAITNVVGSTLSREADGVLYTHAGPEIAVASTKAYTTQLACLALLAIYLQQKIKGELDKELLSSLIAVPEQIKTILAAHENRLQLCAKKLALAKHAFFLGRGLDYATAMEGQLKLKEISYIHCEALAGGELKHGTLALIEEDIPVITVVSQQHLADKMFSNLQEVKARGGNLLVFTMVKNEDFNSLGEVILLPQAHSLIAPLLTVIPLQILAYYAAKTLECDVDKPRNLAKSVTVE